MKTLRGFVLALDDHKCSNVVHLLTNWSTRCLHVPPPGGWRVVGGAHGPGVVQGLAQHVEPAIIVQHEVFEDDWSNGQLSLAGSHQVLDVRVHHGEPSALRVVPVLHGDENVASRPDNTQHLREGRGVDLARSKSIAADDDIVGLVGHGDRAEPVNSRVDVVLVDALLPGLGLEEDYASILSDIDAWHVLW